MPKALEIIGGQATAPGGTLTALTMNAGNSATVRNAALNSYVGLLQAWGRTQANGILRIRSPKLHDNVQGIRLRTVATSPDPLIPYQVNQRLVPQDTLTLELSGSAVGGQIEQAAFLLYYTDLPGSAAHLIGIDELLKRTNNVWTTEVAITPGVAGGWSGQVAINSTFDNFKANTEYAIIGYELDVQQTAVRFTGPDFANLGIGGPGLVSSVSTAVNGRWVTARWFIDLTRRFGIPLIPVMNAANKFGTLVDIFANQAGGATNVTVFLNELAPPSATGFSVGISG